MEHFRMVSTRSSVSRTGVVGLADNDIYQSAVSEDAKKAVEDAKEKLLAGEVTVDSAYGMDEATLKGIINGAQ